MKEITEEQRAKRRAASMLDTLTVLASLKRDMPDVWELAEVVGQWVWVEFSMRPSEQVREYLLDLGFHWNAKRMCWQHSCGKFAHYTHSNPRWKYITVPAKELAVETAQ